MSRVWQGAVRPIRRKGSLRFACSLAALAWLSGAAPSARAQTPFSIGAHVAGHRLSEQDQSRVGYGFRFTYEAYLPFVSLDSEVNFFPTSSGGDLGETQAFFGLKFGKRIGRWGAFLKARPGFTHFGGGGFPQRLTERTKFALDLGGGIERELVPRLDLRWDVSDVRIYYGDAALLAAPGGPAGPRLGTRNTLQTTFGLVLRL
jgi:hypothetical protein